MCFYVVISVVVFFFELVLDCDKNVFGAQLLLQHRLNVDVDTA